MPRSMWRGAIQFGLVTIPLRLYVATESKGVSFNMLHATCLSRVQMKTWCPIDDEPIQRSETVKGYEYAKGQYVVVTDEDLEAVPLRTVRSVEIERFVPASELASMRFVKQAYYMEPEPLGRKAFGLLKDVLADRGLTAICKVVITNREHLAALDPFGPTMLLSTLYWPDEIRPVADLDVPEAEAAIRPAERAMAEQLVAAMTDTFDPAAYRDEYRDALMAIIEAKVAGEARAEAPVEQPSATVVDLMAALEASVAAARASRAAQPVVGEVPAEPAAKAARGRHAGTAAAAGSRERQAAGEGEAAGEGDAAGEGEAAAASGRRSERRRKTA